MRADDCDDWIQMKLKDLAGMLSAEGGVSADAEVTGVSSDSRKIVPGTVFVAVAGAKADGAAYAADAARRGAAAIVAARGAALGSQSAPVLSVDDPRLALARIAARLFPRQPETMVAVTGTSGKTSVAAFTRQIWEQAGLCSRKHRHDRRRCAGPQRLRPVDDARSGRTAQAADGTGGCRRHPCRDGGVEPRPRPAPARRRAACRRRLHQSRPRPHGLSSDGRGVSPRQAAPVRCAAAKGCAGRHLRRRSVVEADDSMRRMPPA